MTEARDAPIQGVQREGRGQQALHGTGGAQWRNPRLARTPELNFLVSFCPHSVCPQVPAARTNCTRTPRFTGRPAVRGCA